MVAWSMPRSLIIWMRLGAIRAMANSPYSEGERIRATKMTPRADMMEEAATPQKRLNPPLAEVLAKLIALLTGMHSVNRFLISRFYTVLSEHHLNFMAKKVTAKTSEISRLHVITPRSEHSNRNKFLLLASNNHN
jgi:hypothetical protein